MRGFGGFALATAVVIAIAATVGIMLFPAIGLEGARAVVTSAGVAFTVQLLTFGIARFFAPANLMAGWGIGMLARFLVLVFHGFVGAQLLGQPMGAALVSLAAFFFLTTLIEPFFLGRPTDPAEKNTSSPST
jgi:hypothetical protein